jgi:hypothetical protein
MINCVLLFACRVNASHLSRLLQTMLPNLGRGIPLDKIKQKKSAVIHLKLLHLIMFHCMTMGKPNTEKINCKSIVKNCINKLLKKTHKLT